MKINVRIVSDYYTDILEVDANIRDATRSTYAEYRQRQKQAEKIKKEAESGKNTGTAKSPSNEQQTSNKVRPKRKDDIAAQRKNNENNIGLGTGILISKVGPASTERDNVNYQGWFGVGFNLRQDKDFVLGYIGLWDREGNGSSTTRLVFLTDYGNGNSSSPKFSTSYTLSPGAFTYRSGGYIFAKVNPYRIKAGSNFVIATFYYGGTYVDRYEYNVPGGGNPGTGNGNILTGATMTEDSQTNPFPYPNLSGGGNGFYIQALNVNAASAGYFG